MAEQHGPTGPDLSAAETAYRRIYGLILAGELAPGQTLNQRRLSRSLGLTTTPVREALRRIEGEGVVETGPDGRLRVIELREESIVGQYMVRTALEVQAVRMFVQQGSEEQVNRLVELADRCDTLYEQPHLDVPAVTEADLQVHRAIAEGSGCRELAREHGRADLMRVFRQGMMRIHDLPVKANRHRQLTETIASRDLAAAEAAIREHLDYALSLELEALRRVRAAAEQERRRRQAQRLRIPERLMVPDQ